MKNARLRSYEANIMYHMLGGKDMLGRLRCSRNFYCAERETPDWEILENLRGMGYVEKTRYTLEGEEESKLVYRVTPEGVQALKEESKRRASRDAES